MAITGDNCNLNKAMANISGVPLIGCIFHRFNLAVEKYLHPHTNIINKINNLMCKLKTIKNSAAFKELTNFKPIQKNDTRWSSTSAMINRYQELKPFILSLAISSNDTTISFIPTVQENSVINKLADNLKKLNSITRALQDTSLTLSEVRFLFDEIVLSYPVMREYLSSESMIQHSPHFESAIIKLQNNEIKLLSKTEIDSLEKLL